MKNINDKTIIIIDGSCVICNAFAKWVFKRDNGKSFLFTDQYSNYFKSNFSNTTAPTPNSIIVVKNGRMYLKAKAIERILLDLEGIYSLIGYTSKIIPPIIKNHFYNIIAVNRKKVFKQTTCSIKNDTFLKNYVLH